MVNYRYLGNSGFKITEITLGNWVTAGGQVGEETAISTVHAALDAGITSFDTADVYTDGAAETILGRALKGQRRESLEIFTKVYFPTGPKGANDTGLSRKHIHDSVHASLRRLNVEYIDLYQAHRFDHETPLFETIQAFADLVRAGKVLYVGVSEWTAEQLREGHALARELGVQLISNQPQYSALWRVIEGEVVPTSQELGISQIVFSPLAQGVLTGKYQPGGAVPAGSRATDTKANGRGFISRFLTDVTLTAVQKLEPIAREAGVSVAQLSLAWVLAQPNIAAALIGASRPEQVRENVLAARFEATPDLLAAVNVALEPAVTTDPALTADISPAARLTP